MILKVDMKLALMQIQPLGKNDLGVDPAETVLDMNGFPFRSRILADGFEGHRPVLIDPKHPFMGDDGAFQIAGTDRTVMVGIQQDDLLDFFFYSPFGI